MFNSLVFQHRFRLLAILLVAVCCGLDSSHAETTTVSGATVITSLPCQIIYPGTYALTQDLTLASASVIAISIEAPGVTIDLNGHTISNTVSPTPSNGSIGILSNNRERVTVRNGTIRGFWAAVYLSSPNAASAYPFGDLLENLTLCENTCIGVGVYATDSVVRKVRVLQMVGQESGIAYVTAFQINGANNRVLDCDVGHMSNAGGNSCGIYFCYAPSGGCAQGNRINPSFGGVTDGIVCSDASCKLSDNIVAAGVAYPYIGGTDAGGNN